MGQKQCSGAIKKKEESDAGRIFIKAEGVKKGGNKAGWFKKSEPSAFRRCSIFNFSLFR